MKTNAHPNDRSELLLKEMRYIAGISTGQVKRVAEAALKNASMLEADAQRPDKAAWASKEHFDAAWSAFGATSFENLHQKLSIDDIKRLFDMFSKAAQRPEMNPLTDGQRCQLWHKSNQDIHLYTRAVEAAHGIKEQS